MKSWIPVIGDGRNGESKPFLWSLPEIRHQDLGRLGPGFGFGFGCGAGLGFGLFGGLGLGLPGLQLGFAIGAGCGIGVGFGYGLGRGIAYDDRRKHSNIGKLVRGGGNLLAGSQLSELFDDLRLLAGDQIGYAGKQIGDAALQLERMLRGDRLGPKKKR